MRKRYDWGAVQRFYDDGNGRDACIEEFGFTLMAWYKAIRRGVLVADLQRKRKYDWSIVQRHYDDGNSFRDCRLLFGFTSGAWAKAVRRGEIAPRTARWPLERVMRYSKSRRTVKRALLRNGIISNRCEICGIESWQGRPLSMHLDHINGVRDDHRMENLRTLCPNCHSQTGTYGARNRRGSSAKVSRRNPG